MPRFLLKKELVLASHNKGKAQELLDLLQPLGFQITLAGELGLPEPIEDADSYIGNAILKARHAALASGKVALADDSGLAVDALNGAPGIFSARWAGPDKNFDRAMERVLMELASHSSRRAAFVCALALAWPDGHVESVEARVSGSILQEKKGTKGFGYDPIFLPDHHQKSFGEMDWVEKKPLTHRYAAFSELRPLLEQAT